MWDLHQRRWKEKYEKEVKKFPGIVYVPYIEFLEKKELTLCLPLQRENDEATYIEDARTFCFYMAILLLLRNTDLLLGNKESWTVGTLSFPKDVIDYKSKISTDWIRATVRKDPCDTRPPLSCKDILKPEALPRTKELLKEFFVSKNYPFDDKEDF